jgi:transglutaminase-like putative cysteine protease
MLDTLEVRIRSAPGPRFTALFGRRYRNGGMLLLARARPGRLVARYALPGDDTWRTSLGPVLRPSPGIESDAPAIVALARRLRGGETDPALVARRLLRWMRDSIGRDVASPDGDAVSVLRQRTGDCNGFARLFVALARAAGIPARPVAGLLRAGDHFYYHAWAEVLLGGYVPVDPMFTEFPAGAGHVRFGRVGPDLQVELLRVLARLDLEVVRSVPGE